jgi:hypothetical protein
VAFEVKNVLSGYFWVVLLVSEAEFSAFVF